MSDYFGCLDRKTRKPEKIREEVPLEPLPVEEPMEVQEDPISDTGILRFLNRVPWRKP